MRDQSQRACYKATARVQKDIKRVQTKASGVVIGKKGIDRRVTLNLQLIRIIN